LGPTCPPRQRLSTAAWSFYQAKQAARSTGTANQPFQQISGDLRESPSFAIQNNFFAELIWRFSLVSGCIIDSNAARSGRMAPELLGFRA
jgi:hypothetical protein